MFKTQQLLRTSISKIEKVYNTGGSNPVLVQCDDLNFYIVKYKRGRAGINLLNEYIGSSFLKIWELNTPDYQFINIKSDHVPLGIHPNIQSSFFDSTCFGTKFSRNYSDITNFLTSSPKNWLKHFVFKEEILLIGLFDLWLCNEDRNINNSNLMYDLSKGNRFVPIDHQYLFNSMNLEYELSQLSSNESILNHPLVDQLFSKNELRDRDMIQRLRTTYHTNIENCAAKLDNIFAEIPQDWNIDKVFYLQLMKDKVFNETWVSQSWKSFLSNL